MSMFSPGMQAFGKYIRSVGTPLGVHTLLIMSCQTPAPVDPSACKKIVILPPESLDERTSDYVIERWTDTARNRKYLRTCDKIVQGSLAKNTFKFMNISHAAPVEASQLSAKQRSILRMKLGATHALSMNYSYRFSSLEIKPLIYDISNDTPATGALRKIVQIKEVESSYFQIPVSRWLKLSLIQLVPTSVVGGFAQSEFKSDYADGADDDLYHKISSERLSPIPPVLGGFRFENILHRNGFNLFDVSLRFIPYFNFQASNNRYTYAPIEEWEAYEKDPSRNYTSFDYDLKFYAGALNILGDLSFYSPLGSFFLSLGPGLALYHYQDSLDNKETNLQPSFLIRLGYRAYFTERWFFQLIVETQFYEKAVDNDYFLSYSDEYSIFGIGYFYPEIQQTLGQRLLD